METSIMIRTSLLFLAGALAALGPTACVAGDDVDASEEVSDELVKIPAAYVLGTLKYGASRNVDYQPAKHRYRAFKFKGKAGDLVKVRVASLTEGRRAMAWLLHDDFRNIVQQDGDASKATDDTYFEHVLAASGTYYIAVREEALRPAKLVVTLRGIAPQEAWGDPFDPGACGKASPMTADDLRAYVGRLSERSLASYAFAHRERSCTGAGCGAWGPLSEENRTCGKRSGSYTYPACELPGRATLRYDTTAGFQLALGYSRDGGNPNYLGSLCSFVGAGEVACNEHVISYTVGSYPRYSTSRRHLEIGAPPQTGDRKVRLSGALTNGCGRLTSTTTGQLGQTSWTETESAVLFRF
jgi:hypothetical protein